MDRPATAGPLRGRSPAFEDVVAARSEGGPGAACPERIGTYRVFSCVTDGTITLFYTDGGFLDSVGFAYAPEAVPAPTGGDVSVAYESMTRPWYTFSQSW
jgi:hypothetical protein